MATFRQHIASGAPWEERVGYSRAVRSGNLVQVAGTIAPERDRDLSRADAGYHQAAAALDVIGAALREAGASFEDVVRTRMFVTDMTRLEQFGRAHHEIFSRIKPASTMVEVVRLATPDALIEIEVDAIISPKRRAGARKVSGRGRRRRG